MDQNRRLEDFTDIFYRGTYCTGSDFLPGQKSKFDEAFNFVDGVRHPLSLVHPEIPQQGDQLKMIGVEFVEGKQGEDEAMPVGKCVRDDVAKNINSSYMDKRRLFPDFQNPYVGAYISEFGLGVKDFRGLIQDLSSSFEHRALVVLDAGCGEGAAFFDLLNLEEVDGEKSVGLTLPRLHSWLPPDPRLLYANIMHCGQKRLFDMVFSAHGAFSYHPTNKYRQKHDGMLSLLHAVSLTRPGGLIFSSSSLVNTTNELVNDGIVELPRSSRFSSERRVLRHPTVDEVMKYTRGGLDRISHIDGVEIF